MGVLGAGQLVGNRDVVLGQGLKTTVVVHVLLNLAGLVWRNALGELLAAEETLEDIVGATPGDAGASGGEELAAQRASTEAVDGLHFLEEGLLVLAQGVKVRFRRIMYLYRYNTLPARPCPAAFR